MYKEYKSDLAYCKSLQKKHGTYAYYFATLLLPQEQRHATFILYGFFREFDQFVDDPNDTGGAQKLEELKKEWEAVLVEHSTDHPVLRATAYLYKKYAIPEEYGHDFISAMAQDITVQRYNTYKDLQEYMYGSASCVGLHMSYILGYDEGALPYAKRLGEAMQYTNFLRDIGEDYDMLGRIYVPLDVMEKHGVTEQMIQEKQVTDEFKHMMQAEIARARGLFEEANKGISMLHHGQYGVAVASTLYESILDSIEAINYDVLSKRAQVPLARKVTVAIQQYVRK